MFCKGRFVYLTAIFFICIYSSSFPIWIKVRNSLISTLMSYITRILMIWLSFFKMLAFSSIIVYNVYNYSIYEVENHD